MDPGRTARAPVMRSFFDTNIIVYLFDDDAPAKKARAQALSNTR
jgi:predicted nucleic acid-binding protein